LGNVYGASEAPIRFLILPRDDASFATVPLPWMLLNFATTLLFGLVFPKLETHPILRWTSRCIGAFSILIVIAALLAPYLSEYLFLFSVRSLLNLTLLCYAPAILNVGVMALRSIAERFPNSRHYSKCASPAALILLFFLSTMLVQLRLYEGNYSGFLHISQKRYDRIPFQIELPSGLLLTQTGGYDGQFFYLMTFDPFLSRYSGQPEMYRRIVDDPPFRYRRIGFSLLTKLFSLDQPGFYPQTMMFLILAFHVVAGIFLVKIAQLFGKSPFWALLYVLIPGFSKSLATALPEPISGALLLAGIYFYLREKLPLVSLCFAASLMVRETGLLLLAILMVWEFLKRRNLKTVFLLGLAAAPHFLWRGILTWRLFTTYGWESFFHEPANLTAPFVGVFDLFSAIRLGTYPRETVASGLTFPWLLFFLLLLSIAALRKRKDFLTCGLFAYSFVALSLNFQKVWVHVSNVERQSFESFLCLLTLFLTWKENFFLKYAFYVLFGCTFLYDWLFLTESQFFRQGFVLRPLMDFLFSS
jgi:hypothetical protein